MFEYIPRKENQDQEREVGKETAEFKLERDWNTEEEKAIEIISRLQDNGFEAYFVGGAVRDYLLGKDPKDIDIATSASLEEIENIFGDSVYYIGQQKEHGIAVIDIGAKNDEETCGGGIEIAVFRKDIYEEDNKNQSDNTEESTDSKKQKRVKGRHADKIKTDGVTTAEDATRRDLTINALFYDPNKGEVVDYVGGLEDLRNKTIRFAGDPIENIMQDRMRVIRYFRFKGTLNFEEDANCAKVIREWLKDEDNKRDFKEMFYLNQRIRPELNKILRSDNRIAILEDLMETGIMELIIPEIAAMQNVEQPRKHHSEGNVWEHTKLCLNNLPDDAPDELIWAVLLHDIGKKKDYEDLETANNDDITFYKHEKLSAELVEKILKTPAKSKTLEHYEKVKRRSDIQEEIDAEDFAREKKTSKEGLGFENEFVDKVTWLVANHMKKSDFVIMKESKKIELMKNPNFPLLMELWKIDSRSSIPEDQNRIVEKEKRMTDIEQIYEKFKEEEIRNKTNLEKSIETGEFIDSREIMDMLRNFGWNIDTKNGMVNFDDLKFYEIIPILNEHIKELFAKNEHYSKEDVIKELENIIKEDGILKEILQDITANEEITAMRTEAVHLLEKPKKLKQLKKDIGAKANELFKRFFEERID